MLSVVQDITIKKNTTFELEVEVQDSVGEAEDLTGYTGQMQIRATAADDDVLAEANVSVDPAGIVLAVIPPAETANADWVAGVYDLIITDGSRILPIAEGNVRLTERVTR